MSMNRNPTLNASGCRDMTAYLALQAVSRQERRDAGNKPEPVKVYICSPFAGDTTVNAKKALRYCRFVLDRGKLPIAPHCYFQLFMDENDPTERELGLSFGLRLLYECRELWIFGTRITDGMKREILAAKWRGIRIRQFAENMEEM